MEIRQVNTMKSGIKLSIAISVFGLISIFNVYAQTDEDDEEFLLGMYGDETMISIATGVQQSIRKAPAIATVISAQQILEIGASDLDELLETVPGLHVGRASVGYNPLYTFRGIHSSYNPQVLVLINGIPITNLLHSDRGQSWGGMPVDGIAKIEIIRGPGSALYGADAFAGTINIITKTAEDIQGTDVKLAAGSYNTKDIAVLYGKTGDTRYSLTAEYHHTDGQDGLIESDAQTFLDSIFGTSASVAPGTVNLPRENLDLRFDIAHGDIQFRAGYQRRRDWGAGVGAAEALDPWSRYKSDRINADINWQRQFDNNNWDLMAQASYLNTTHEIDEDLIIFPPGVDLGWGVYPDGFIGNPESLEAHTRINFTATYSGHEKHLYRFGTGYYFGDLYEVRESKNFGVDPATDTPLPPTSGLVDVTDTPYIYLQEGTRRNTYFFVQDIWQFAADWELTAGLRYDDYSDFGSTTNPRLALVWSTSRKLTTKLLYGRAFRAPSFAETRAINNPIVLGNPNLDPETLSSIELAFDYQFTEKLNAQFNLFDYAWRDVIEFVPDSSGSSSTAQNSDEQDGQGFEFEIAWKPSNDIKVGSNFSFVNTKDRDAVEPNVPFAPHRQLFLYGQWDVSESLYIHMQVNHVMDRYRQNADPRNKIADNTIFDTTLNYKFRDNLKLRLVVHNLFDEDAREPSFNPVNLPNDLPLAGRNYRFEIIYSL